MEWLIGLAVIGGIAYYVYSMKSKSVVDDSLDTDDDIAK